MKIILSFFLILSFFNYQVFFVEAWIHKENNTRWVIVREYILSKNEIQKLWRLWDRYINLIDNYIDQHKEDHDKLNQVNERIKIVRTQLWNSSTHRAFWVIINYFESAIYYHFLTYETTQLDFKYPTVIYSDDLFQISLPENWKIFTQRWYDLYTDSLLLLPPESASRINISSTSLDNWSDRNMVYKILKEEELTYMELRGTASFFPYVRIDQREEFLNSLLKENLEYWDIEVNLKTINNKRVIFFIENDNDYITENASWFATPDIYWRDQDIVATFVWLEYRYHIDNYEPELFEYIIANIEDKINEEFVKDLPIPRDIQINDTLNYETVYKTSEYLPETSIWIWAQKNTIIIFDEWNEQILKLDLSTWAIEEINLEPFTYRDLSLITGRYWVRNEIFSPDESKIVIYIREYWLAIYDLITHQFHLWTGIDGFSFETWQGKLGWISNNEIIYTCYPENQWRNISTDDSQFCIINIDTWEGRLSDTGELETTTYHIYGKSSHKWNPIFVQYFEKSECLYINNDSCLWLSRAKGLIYFKNNNTTYKVIEGNHDILMWWKLWNDIYLLIKDYAFQDGYAGGDTSIIKFEIENSIR